MKWCSEIGYLFVIIESSFSSMAKLNIIPLIWINETAATLISRITLQTHTPLFYTNWRHLASLLLVKRFTTPKVHYIATS